MSAKQNLFKSLGSYLRDKREKKGMTQTEVATALQVRPQFVSNWERGLSAPPLRLMKKIIQAYGIPKNEAVRVLVQEYEAYIKKNLGIR